MSRTLKTRLTERLGIEHPIISAPMAFAAGGALAAAVSDAGGLGLIGGGYGNAEWLESQFAAAGNRPVGCGFITWSMARQPALLEQALSHAPRALMLSFGDPRPFASAVKEAGARLICQCQTLVHVAQAVEAGADIVVVQGTEAGGHGSRRATFTLVPEAADYLAQHAPETMLVAAGGIADGRGLAAALMLGADGVLVGSRFWASREALVPPSFHAAAIAAGGDGTVRQSAVDIVRGYDWPPEFDARVLRNAFTERWHGHEVDLRAAIDNVAGEYAADAARGDAQKAGIFIGEAAGLIHDTPAAGEIVQRLVIETIALLERKAPGFVA
jgi:nitronate monooxygenase